jgi:hypothetical protein
MTGQATLKNVTDVYVTSKTPTKNTGASGAYLYMGVSGAYTYNSYIFFAQPFPVGATIISAKLRMVQTSAANGTRSISVDRVTKSWSATTVTWSKKPTVAATPVTVTKTAAESPAKTVWEFDISAIMQAIANGSVWYGLAITGANLNAQFYSTQHATTAYRPVVDITWAMPPVKPNSLHPGNAQVISLNKPILRGNYSDPSSASTLTSLQVRIFDTEANATANASASFDSGEVIASSPQLDLATTAYGGIAVNATRWWRMRVKSSIGLWSDWSDPTSFTRKEKGTIALTSTTNIAEPTPPVAWTFTGSTQTAYEVIVVKINGASRTRLWSSGKITSTNTFATIGNNVMTDASVTYGMYLRVWDDMDREAIPNDPPYVEYWAQFSYTLDTGVSPVTSLVVTTDPVYPWATMTWSRANTPDGWTIYRNDTIIYTTSMATELLVGGSTTNYTYTDRAVPPRVPVEYKVIAVVNGAGSANPPTSTVEVNPGTVVLSDMAGENPVLIYNYEHDMTINTTSAVHYPLGGGSPVLITQSRYGYSGKITGILDTTIEKTPTLTSQDIRDRYKRIVYRDGAVVCLTLLDQTMLCFVRSANIKPMMTQEGRMFYAVDFEFYQMDWIEP